MNDDRPDKPVWLMRGEATLATNHGRRRQGATMANIARALSHQGTAPPKEGGACDKRSFEMRAVLSSAVLVFSVIVACSQHDSVSIAGQPVAIQRTLIETPPSLIPVPPLPVLEPGTEYTSAQSEALAYQPYPKASLELQVTASQRAMGRKVVHVATGTAAGVEALRSTDVSHLVGLSQADTMKLFGPPVAPKSFPPYQAWTYHSTNCDLMLFFFPEVSGTAFRALTYQIIERDASDAAHTACLASLTRLSAS
jgi:hypothetical protein